MRQRRCPAAAAVVLQYSKDSKTDRTEELKQLDCIKTDMRSTLPEWFKGECNMNSSARIIYSLCSCYLTA